MKNKLKDKSYLTKIRKKYQSGGITSGEVGAEQVIHNNWFKPNFALLDKAMATRQNKYDTRLATTKQLKAKVNEVPALKGYDLGRQHELQDELDFDLKGVKSAYDGDLSRADVEFEAFTEKVTGLFDVHGELRAIGNRYNGYVENDKKLKEAYEKGDITRGQYGAVQIELARTAETGVGKDKKNWNTWQEVSAQKAIKEEEFMNEFIKNWKNNSEGKWGRGKFDAATGKMLWKKGKNEWASEDEIRKEAMEAYYNAGSRTGQFTADYNWQRWMTAGGDYGVYSKTPTEQKTYFTQSLQTKITGSQNVLKALDTLQGEDLQRYMSNMGVEIGITGKNDSATKRMRDQLYQTHARRVNEMTNSLAEINTFTDEEYMAYDQKQWTQRHLEKAASPYAAARSEHHYDEDLKISDSDYLKHQHAQQQIRLKYQMDRQLIDYKWELDNPVAPSISYTAPGVEINSIYGGNKEEFDKMRSALTSGFISDVKHFDKMMVDQFTDGKGGYDTEKLMAWAQANGVTSTDGQPLTPDQIKGKGKELIERMVRNFTNPENLANLEIVEQQNGGIMVQNKDGEMISLPMDRNSFMEYQSRATHYIKELGEFDARLEQAEEAALNGTVGVDGSVNWDKIVKDYPSMFAGDENTIRAAMKTGMSITALKKQHPELAERLITAGRDAYRNAGESIGSINKDIGKIDKLIGLYNNAKSGAAGVTEEDRVKIIKALKPYEKDLAAMGITDYTNPNALYSLTHKLRTHKNNLTNKKNTYLDYKKEIDDKVAKSFEERAKYVVEPIFTNEWAGKDSKTMKLRYDAAKRFFNSEAGKGAKGLAPKELGMDNGVHTFQEVIDHARELADKEGGVFSMDSDPQMSNNMRAWDVPFKITGKDGSVKHYRFYAKDDNEGMYMHLPYQERIAIESEREVRNNIERDYSKGLDKTVTPMEYTDVNNTNYKIQHYYKNDPGGGDSDVTTSLNTRSKRKYAYSTITSNNPYNSDLNINQTVYNMDDALELEQDLIAERKLYERNVGILNNPGKANISTLVLKELYNHKTGEMTIDPNRAFNTFVTNYTNLAMRNGVNPYITTQEVEAVLGLDVNNIKTVKNANVFYPKMDYLYEDYD